MLDMGFYDDINFIIKHLPAVSKTCCSLQLCRQKNSIPGKLEPSFTNPEEINILSKLPKKLSPAGVPRLAISKKSIDRSSSK